MSIAQARLKLQEPFDLHATLASGAAFSWGRYDRRGRLIVFGEPDQEGWFTAPTYGCVLRLRQPDQNILEIECSAPEVVWPSLARRMSPGEFARWYFRMEEKMADVIRSLEHDPSAASAAALLPGLRLIRVEPAECLTAFLTSPQNRIPKIALILNAISRSYGRRILTDWGPFYIPPPPDRLSRARPAKLASCGLRYGLPQAKNMIRTFRRLAENGKFFTENSAPAQSYESAWQNVMSTVVGAGPKVSDCVCLFGLGHLEAVPVDVHVFNSTVRLYRKELRGLKAKAADFLSLREYRRIGDFYRTRFGRTAGYAQQYLFTAERLRRGFFKVR